MVVKSFITLGVTTKILATNIFISHQFQCR